jgi:hypothetical protein
MKNLLSTILDISRTVRFRPVADIGGSAHSLIMTGALTFAVATAIATIVSGEPVGSEQQEDSFLVTVATRPDKCNLNLAAKVDLLTLASQPKGWVGKCVAVGGYWQGRALFAQQRDARSRYAQSRSALRERRVGIYGTGELLRSAPRAAAAYTAVGIVGDCEALWAGVVMVMGYCHYTGGPYIAVSEMRRR